MAHPEKVTFKCSKCNETLVAPRDKAGMKGQCPNCGEVLEVPGKSDDVTSPGTGTDK